MSTDQRHAGSMPAIAETPSHRASQADAPLPGPVADLLDEVAATELLAATGLTITHARPDYVRHKPGVTSIVGYRFTTPGLDTEGLGYVQWCADPERAAEIYRKALTLRPRPSSVGVSTIRVDDHTVFYGFPNDARLRRLRWYTNPRKLRHSLAPVAPPGEQISKTDCVSTVLKYKPERRLVTRVDLATTDGGHEALLVRYTTGAHAPRLAAVATALLANGVHTPAPRAQFDNGRVGVDDFVDGVELRTCLLRSGSVTDELAASLLAFHATAPPPILAVRNEADDLANAINALSTLSLWDRDLGQLAQQVAARLRVREPNSAQTVGLIHGDLHAGNILVDDDQAWFIDLERATVGAPASDLGRLRAHALSLELHHADGARGATEHVEAVIDRYRSYATHGRHEAIDDRTLTWYCAIALVDLALLAMRQVEPGWKERSRAFLAAATAALEQHPGRPVDVRRPLGARPNAGRSRRAGPPPAWASRRTPGSQRRFGRIPMSRWSAEWSTVYPRGEGLWTLRCGDRWGVLDPEHDEAVPVDPSTDRRLPALAGARQSGRLLGYRTGRRAIVEAPTSFLKVVRPSRVDALVERHEIFSEAKPPFAVPRVLDATVDGCVELSTMAGRSLHQSIRADPDRSLDDIGSLVAALHDQPDPNWLPIRKPDQPESWVAISQRSPTVHQETIEQVAMELPALEPRPEVIVHGDLHDKNIFCDAEQLAFIDLDGLALGSPEDDIANLAVHLELRNLQAPTGLAFGARSAALYHSYQTSRSLDTDRLQRVERHTWFRLACLYQYRTRSAHLVPRLLHAAGSDPG